MNIIEAVVKLFTWNQMSEEERAVAKKVFRLYGWRAFVLLCFVYASGVVPGTGFVRAGDLAAIKSDMTQVKSDLTDRRKRELPGLILAAMEKWCGASGEIKRIHLETLNGLKTEYVGLFGRPFDRLKCEDLK